MTYLLPTTVTAQQSPRFMSGGPEEGSTTPGSMRSWGKQSVCLNINMSVRCDCDRTTKK